MVRPPEAPAGNPLGTAIVAVVVVVVVAVLAVVVGGVSEAFEGPSHEGETLRAEKERPEYIEVPGPVRQPR